ncbi:cell wall protein, putative (macronuclear) [Tetrahymena thermophila SB210]|uniref:Cell wall protein, putative n=1 Tax=Tetrahymena thermophila (strain SB210) TaxID=312017 RepID=Q22BV1_TETTS|nr:cell wall protein, putative [Tetrahymena thermophila SB210]EAR82749.2 cell wall protein, putative [Tetrahymena thermophila SB210]|eukprot:XP_001030412.2 cell wall protein, putative [Tetrahymena thermophila SB210]
MHNRIDNEGKNSNSEDTFLSTEEVDALVENYRLTIENMTLEGEQLKPKIEEGKQKLASLEQHKSLLDKDMNEYKHKIETYQPKVQEILEIQKGYYQKNAKINQIFKKYKIGHHDQKINTNANFEKAIKSEPLIELEEKKSNNSNQDFTQDHDFQFVQNLVKSGDSKLSQQDKDNLNAALQMFIAESEQQVQNEAKLEKLFSDTLNKREEVLKKESKLLVIQYCIHCKQRFSPLCNEEGSCIYHQGNLKFYSCRTCGGDEYYNCCGKCLKCSKGCGKGKHAAKEKVYKNELTPQSKPKSVSLNNISNNDFYQITFESLQFIPKK